jgi:hypothetical protein
MPSWPHYFESAEDRKASPFQFWFQAAIYVVIIAMVVNLVIHVLTYTPPQAG